MAAILSQPQCVKYTTVYHDSILHTTWHLQVPDKDQTFDSHKTLHASPSQVSYEVSFVSISEINHHIIKMLVLHSPILYCIRPLCVYSQLWFISRWQPGALRRWHNISSGVGQLPQTARLPLAPAMVLLALIYRFLQDFWIVFKHEYKIPWKLFPYYWSSVEDLEPLFFIWLTQCGPVTYISITKLTIIGSDNGLSPGRCQAIIWTNKSILLIGSLGTNFSEILIEIHDTFPFKKMHLKRSSAK